MQPLTEDISALNHPTNHYNCASDQLPPSHIITPIFSVSFDGNRAAVAEREQVPHSEHRDDPITYSAPTMPLRTCQGKNLKGTTYIAGGSF